MLRVVLLWADPASTLLVVYLMGYHHPLCRFSPLMSSGVHFAQRGFEVVILLAGGNKFSQPKDIKRALELARRL